ncbi:vWA domain-containing protein [Pseudomonas sp. N040]|uniref:vWA domain-containing protein n=1 Tax=Pseudomonas sp. N040 TaxID=2785325 RepID=UPI0018A29D9B|nr:VWA domain-containing protein [Pseudomonas sp. N040]MBF7729249.1 VWA domain-containing protein [Pseudomonas sp. N040]MBW7012889.1 VWA domain-containing protein [Pseudomonas sp. N040]
MWQFDYPWLFALLPLPLLGWRYLPAYKEARQALRTPFFGAMSQALGIAPQQSGVRQNRWQLSFNLLVWGLLLIALARPVWVEPPLQQTKPTRDLLLAIDISQSMEAKDYLGQDGIAVDRLTAVKQVVQTFIDQRPDDRLGLILFGGGAFAQAPLTLDHGSLKLLLDQAGIGMAGPSTAIGDAIGLGIKMLDKSEQPDKTLILLTDGNDNHSVIPPDQAAALAASKHIRIHAIGIGDPQASGENRVDAKALDKIANATGGRSFMATDSSALAGVYQTLDQITPHEVQHLSFQPKRDLFVWPLGAGLLLLTLYHGLAALRGRRHSRPRVAASSEAG